MGMDFQNSSFHGPTFHPSNTLKSPRIIHLFMLTPIVTLVLANIVTSAVTKCRPLVVFTTIMPSSTLVVVPTITSTTTLPTTTTVMTFTEESTSAAPTPTTPLAPVRCGKEYGNQKCLQTGEYPCCSKGGWCGNTPDHCEDAGCQEEFGYCAPIRITNTGRCGKDYSMRCKDDKCCSRGGWCGTTLEHCEWGCQKGFGRCAPPPHETRSGRCGQKHGFRCKEGECCSKWGWCGTTDDHCLIGCQNGFGKCLPVPPLTTNGRCGKDFNTRCSDTEENQCCSRGGWCGNSVDHCGNGCQKGFGLCNTTPLSPPTSNKNAGPTPVFDPPTLTLNDLTQTNSFKVRLSGQPSTTLNVSFSFPAFRFSNCFLTFGKEDWSTWKTVTVSSPPVFSDAFPITYSVPVQVRSAGTLTSTTYYSMNRNPVRGYTGSSSGDPHYVQFNGFKYSNQRSATVYLVNHQHFSVQALQQQCNSKFPEGPSCNQAVAVRYGSSAMVVDTRDNILRVGSLTPNTNNMFYLFKDGSHRIDFPDGSFVSATVLSWPDRGGVHVSMSISVSLAPHWTDFNGILGRPSDHPGILVLPSGATTKRGSEHMAAWIVPSSDNLLNGNVRRSTPAFLPSYCVPPTTNLYTRSLQQYTVRNSVGNLSKRQVAISDEEENFAALLAASRPIFLQQASAVCEKALSNNACGHIVDSTGIFDSCYRDAVISQTFGFTNEHVINLHQQCLGATRSLQGQGDEDSTLEGNYVQKQAGLGDFNCPNECGGRGKCTEVGCICNSTSYGNACQFIYPTI